MKELPIAKEELWKVHLKHFNGDLTLVPKRGFNMKDAPQYEEGDIVKVKNTDARFKVLSSIVKNNKLHLKLEKYPRKISNDDLYVY